MGTSFTSSIRQHSTATKVLAAAIGAAALAFGLAIASPQAAQAAQAQDETPLVAASTALETQTGLLAPKRRAQERSLG